MIMRLYIIPPLMATAFMALPVYGGNRAWESSTKFAGSKKSSDSSSRKSNNSTAQTFTPTDNERYFAIKPSEDDTDAKLWPEGVVRFCYDPETWPEKGYWTTKSILEYHVNRAMTMWYAAGVPEQYTWSRIEDQNVCEAEDRRREFLLISYSPDSVLKSTVGVPSRGSPQMTLSDSTEIGMMNVAANVAHEIGHVWGLLHEHQNPAFWGSDYSEADGTIFTKFYCQNLKDYDRILQRLQATDMPKQVVATQMRQLCTSQRAAAAYRFSAQEYLPLIGEPSLTDSGVGIDWDSIMIYPSGAGGKTTANPAVNDMERLPVLMKPDGSRIPTVRIPSPRDAEGINELYNYNPKSTWKPLGDRTNKLKTTFERMRAAGSGTSCD